MTSNCPLYLLRVTVGSSSAVLCNSYCRAILSPSTLQQMQHECNWSAQSVDSVSGAAHKLPSLFSVTLWALLFLCFLPKSKVATVRERDFESLGLHGAKFHTWGCLTLGRHSMSSSLSFWYLKWEDTAYLTVRGENKMKKIYVKWMIEVTGSSETQTRTRSSSLVTSWLIQTKPTISQFYRFTGSIAGV